MPSWKKLIVSGSDAAIPSVSTAADFTIDAGGDIILDADGTDIKLKDGGTEFGSFKRASSDFIIKSATNDKDIVFKGEDSDGGGTITAMTLDMSAGGRVGIGTTAPEGKVHIFQSDANVAPDSDGDDLVIESDADTGISILSGEGSGETGALIFGSDNDAFGAGLQYSYHGSSLRLMTANSGHSLQFATDNNTTAMTIDSSQNALFNANISGSQIEASGDVIAFGSSDERLKDNIKPITEPLWKVSQIGGYTFDWNDKQETYKGSDIGVVAQEIHKILPEIVTERGNGYLAVKYEKIVPLLIESIKELKKEVDDIKQKCDCLNK